VAHLGAFTALTMVFCLFGDLLVLPAQILAFGRRRECPGSRAVAVETQDALLPALLQQEPGGRALLDFLGESPLPSGAAGGRGEQTVRVRPLDGDAESWHHLEPAPGGAWWLSDAESARSIAVAGGR
jgi:hypothetical protein